MIVVPEGTGLRLVRQPDHAEVSGVIASAWRRADGFPAGFWRRLVEAARRHDDGWMEEERRPSLDPGGRPHDFKSLPTQSHLPVWRRSVELARAADPYRALLIAQHSRWLYASFTDRDGPGRVPRLAQDFMAEMDRDIETGRARVRAEGPEGAAAVEDAALLAARRLLSFFDGLSLRLLGAISLRKTEPLRFGETEAELKLEEAEGGLTLSPWPFEKDELRLEVKAVRLSRARWKSAEELLGTMAQSPVEVLRWRLRGPEKKAGEA